MATADTYNEMITAYKRIQRYGQIAGLLHWDQAVNMPPKGIEARSEQLALISGEIHRMTTDDAFVGLVNRLAASADELNEDQQVNVKRIKRAVDKETKVPQSLVEELTRHASQSHAVWEKARADSDFAAFAPQLERMIELKKQEAEAKAEDGQSVYDVLLDDFEMGMSEKQTSEILEDLRGRLVPLIQKVLGATPPAVPPIAGKPFPIDKQREFGLRLVRGIGFDFEGGRQDISVHPFCTGERGDVRITTRFYDDDPRPALFGMLHEAGHALYEQGSHPDHDLTPRGSSVSLGVHESQSRLWENLVGRSLSFWKAYYGDLQKTFPDALGGVPIEGYHLFINEVKGSLIRVEADEATYNLHIILRFEIERDLFAGKIAANDLPSVWNAKMKEYLDVDVPDDARGVLQDVHWCEGLMGYFPTYSFGNLFAAQLFEAAERDLGDLNASFEKREFAPLLSWLRERIHTQGMRYEPRTLIEKATGTAPTAEAFIRYMEKKLGALYGI